MIVKRQKVKLIDMTNQPEEKIEKIARVCYKSEEKITGNSAPRFIERLINSGHEAMLEHGYAIFHIVTDRGISHEIVRHRLASYAQESTRYCRYASEITVIEPPNINNASREAWLHSISIAEDEYIAMLNQGCSPQIARSVLPTCLKTEIVMAANFREWRHFLKLRGAKNAHPQIQELAREILMLLVCKAPNIFKDIAKEITNAKT